MNNARHITKSIAQKWGDKEKMQKHASLCGGSQRVAPQTVPLVSCCRRVAGNHENANACAAILGSIPRNLQVV